MEKHTPGPWRVEDDKYILANKKLVAKIVGGPQGKKANARLIAAAPELLEALEFVLTAIRWSGWSIDDPKWKEPMVKARRAIVKANGE